MTAKPTIPEFFATKTIFITGGSGFLGKILVEKLLRSCPDLNVIYLLLREKKGKNPEERINTIIDLPLFDVVRSQNPDSLKKIKFITGDVKQLGLGITPEDQKLLIDKVNIVFHVAASVRFDDSLGDAVSMNTRGTREVANLALKMKKLDVLVHVSTTYCHTDKKIIEEKLYPSDADWRKTIEIAETVDRNVLNALTEKYIHPLPNTYTFTKSLGEQVVNDLCNGKIPSVVVRPSIVTQTHFEPVPGWIDNFNGPMGLAAGTGIGIVRVAYGKAEIVTDCVPADLIVKAIIISAWKQANYQEAKERLALNFYNCSNNNYNPVFLEDMINGGQKAARKNPFSTILWYPSVQLTSCYYEYFIKMILYHLLPALLIDGLLKISGRKPMLFRLQRRIYTATTALAYFTNNDWRFNNTNAIGLEKCLLPQDFEAFSFGQNKITLQDTYDTAFRGIKKYILKEDGDEEMAKKRLKKMRLLANTVNLLWYFGLLWFLFVKIDVFGLIWNAIIMQVSVYFTTD